MQVKQSKTPRARNNPARTSLQNYFERISNSLEDRIPEYLLMKKYARIYGESQKLLEIERTIDIAAGSIYEINLDEKGLVSAGLDQAARLLNDKNALLKRTLQGKPVSDKNKLIQHVAAHIQRITNNLQYITRSIARINEITPILKALLKTKDKENYGENPLLIEISNALKKNIEEPNLAELRELMEKSSVSPVKFDSRLNFEHLNDVSDKLIGLLNDKLLLVISISETIIAGIEDDGINDVDASKRLPDELMVLFLASSILDIFRKIKEIRNCVKNISDSIKSYMAVMESGRLENNYKAFLLNGENSVHNVVARVIPTHLKRILPPINEVAANLDSIDLKLDLKHPKLAKGATHDLRIDS
ncbi:MAG: hypothetical protein R3E08_03745 [Thiotrichaceae bacterium]